MKNNLEFRGSWTDLFGAIITMLFLSVLTLGIYVPWGYVRLRQTVLTKTYQGDRSLQFDGTGGQLFGEALWILLFSVITLGLYPILGFAQLRMLRWDSSHTILPDGRRLEYRGSAMGIFFENLVIGLLTLITLGIFFFWGYARFRRYVLRNTYIQGYGDSLSFAGTGGQYFGILLVNLLLTVVTFGFYSLLGFATVRVLKWDAENTYIPTTMQTQVPLSNMAAMGGVNVTVNITR